MSKGSRKVLAITFLCLMLAVGCNKQNVDSDEMTNEMTDEITDVIRGCDRDKEFQEPPFFNQEYSDLWNSISGTVIRDDCGFRMKLELGDIMDYISTLKELNLQPIGDIIGINELKEKEPFTIMFEYEERGYEFSFTEYGVIYDGGLYIPKGDNWLETLYSGNRQWVITGDIKSLSDIFKLDSEADVSKIEFEQEGFNGDTKGTVASELARNKIRSALDDCVLRLIGSDDQIPHHTGSDVINLNLLIGGDSDSSIRVNIDDSYMEFDNQKETMRFVLLDGKEELRASLEDVSMTPSVNVELNDIKIGVFAAEYDYAGDTRLCKNDIPFYYYNSKSESINDSKIYGKIEFDTKPDSYEIEISKIDSDKLNSIAVIEPNDAGDFQVETEPGEYAITITAVYDSGSVSYFSGFYSVDSPSFMSNAEYKNGSGNVKVYRSDIGVMKTGASNAPYVEFISSLGLKKCEDGVFLNPLDIRYTFTLEFLDTTNDKGVTYSYNFTAGSGVIVMNGIAYVPEHPEVISSLYQKEGELLNLDADILDLLSQDMLNFGAVFDLSHDELESIEKRTDTGSQDGLDQAVTKFKAVDEDVEFDRVWNEVSEITVSKDILGEFKYRSDTKYIVTLKDGTVYEIGQKVLKNNEDTGYYVMGKVM